MLSASFWLSCLWSLCLEISSFKPMPSSRWAAAAVGIDALFMEVHDDPDQALCDGPNMINLKDLPTILKQVRAIKQLEK